MTTRYLTAEEFFVQFPDFATKQILGGTRADPDAWDAAVLSSAIERAEAFVDSFVQVQYILPLKSVPVVLKNAVGDIARYYLYTEKPQANLTKLYEDAVSFLRQVAGRKNMLGVPDTATAVAPSTRQVLVRKSKPSVSTEGF